MNTGRLIIDAAFDGGNILVEDAENPAQIRLAIKCDSQAEFRQWFYFRVFHASGQTCRFSIMNAAKSSYPDAWIHGGLFFSTDRQSWILTTTHYDGDVLTFEITPEADVFYVALHTPFSYEQHLDLVCRATSHPGCVLYACANSVQGRKIEVLQIGSSRSDAPVIWIISRQHPAETMAEWFMDGLLERLLSSDESVVSELVKRARLFLVPNMNPDGSVLGHFRTNAPGIDLNRAWDVPCIQSSPEVHGIKSLMETTGVDVFLDIHGDEEIHAVFAAGCEGIPGYNKRQAALDQQFRKAFHLANSDFDTSDGYPKDSPGEGDLSIACNQIGMRFNCLSLTIEIPFVDNDIKPDSEFGWSSSRSRRLGATVIDPIHALLDLL